MADLEQKDENLKNEQDGANSASSKEDSDQAKDKLLAELEAVKKEKEALAKEKDTMAKDLEKRIAELEKEKTKEAQNEIDKLVAKYVPFDKEAFNKMNANDKREHILRSVMPWKKEFKDMPLEEVKGAIGYAMESQENKFHEGEKDTASKVAEIFSSQSKYLKNNNRK